MISIKFSSLSSLPADLLPYAEELCRSLSINVSDDAPVTVTLKEGSCVSLSGSKENILITYGERCQLYRALSLIPEFLRSGRTVEEQNRYGMLCYMADMSRNAVFNMDGAKRMIRYLASMGYTALMLYTEDTYEIPEFKYFGYMRGRFSHDELKEIDDYAYGFGIEVIPCIQTLAHLNAAVRWPDFAGYVDIDDILVVGDERTYKFVDAAISTCRQCFRSKRINLGMDEAFKLGRGAYLDRNGIVKRSDIMCDHLERVVKICQKYDFAPMIWSDMFFRSVFNGVYRVKEGEIPQEVIDKVPEGLTLIYWDYYDRDGEIFSHMVDCHQKFNNPMAFAGGAWKWSGFGAHNRFSLASSELQLDICEEKGVDSVLVTGWGDNGGEASQFSSLATLLYFAERKYRGKDELTPEYLNERAKDCFGASFDDLLCFDLPNDLPLCDTDTCVNPRNPDKYLFYNDCLAGLMDKHLDEATAAAAYGKNAARARELTSNENFGYAFDTTAKLCEFLSHKCDMGVRLRRAYKADDRTALAALVDEINLSVGLLDEFIAAFQKQWMTENKPFGLDASEIRMGGLRLRMLSAARRVGEYLDGKATTIPELEEEILPFRAGAGGASPYILDHSWKDVATTGLMR